MKYKKQLVSSMWRMWREVNPSIRELINDWPHFDDYCYLVDHMTNNAIGHCQEWIHVMELQLFDWVKLFSWVCIMGGIKIWVTFSLVYILPFLYNKFWLYITYYILITIDLYPNHQITKFVIFWWLACFRFTQRNLLRVYPKGIRFDSSNYNPVIGWMHGAQMVAFNMQVRF